MKIVFSGRQNGMIITHGVMSYSLKSQHSIEDFFKIQIGYGVLIELEIHSERS